MQWLVHMQPRGPGLYNMLALFFTRYLTVL